MGTRRFVLLLYGNPNADLLEKKRFIRDMQTNTKHFVCQNNFLVLQTPQAEYTFIREACNIREKKCWFSDMMKQLFLSYKLGLSVKNLVF